MVQIATPTKEQIAQDPRAFSLYCQALHGNSGFNAQVRTTISDVQIQQFQLDVLLSSQLRDVTELVQPASLLSLVGPLVPQNIFSCFAASDMVRIGAKRSWGPAFWPLVISQPGSS
jgi:hypothetical protein